MRGVVTAVLVLAGLAVSDAARSTNHNHGMGPSSERPGPMGPSGGKPGGRPRRCIPPYISLDHYHQEPKTSTTHLHTDSMNYQGVVDFFQIFALAPL